ncbi:hypothetical protein JIG36_41270 [Actinoplanes sp. LDG1-06]|uniref:Uncharacterized protein n=1 Tax=Paractinoplanes ovalisporus TaxID=2810368 RepID=A0ABS2AQ17_9ACTN|nr:hypothetical protein [Actinoplanes ovalisporus]MBM2621952.1 hypothetical protein [Actinoplanes ovalisporus]
MPEWKPWLVNRSKQAVRPREVRHELVESGVVTAYVILWETDRGRVLFFERLRDDESTVDETSFVRELGRDLLGPEPWDDVVLLNPFPVLIDSLAHETSVGPHLHVRPARFTTAGDGKVWLASGSRQLAGPIGRTLQTDLPIWVKGSNTVVTARAALAQPGQTVTVPDESKWPRSEARLLRAIDAGLPESHPYGWAALAFEHNITLNAVRAGHARLPDRGDGWFLAARPAPPQPPERLSRLLEGLTLPAERGEPVGREAISLESAAGDMDRDDPRLDPYQQAAEFLRNLMVRNRSAEIVAGRTPTAALDRVRAAQPLPVTAVWAGPVVETWLRSLTPVPLPLRLHRIATLLRHTHVDEVSEAYRDKDGRYVLVTADDPPRMIAEWQRDPAVAATWTGETVLAMDRPDGPLLALTPEAGRTRADMVPGSLVDGGPLRFTGERVMRMLLPLALDPATTEFTNRSLVLELLVEHPGMRLQAALTPPGNAVRLGWDDVRAFAAEDVAHVRRLLAGDPPPYQYFGIVNTIISRDPYQVVRRTVTVDGHEVDERVHPDGSGTSTTLLWEVMYGRHDDEYRRLSPAEASHYAGLRRASRRG